eukprot:TRINITY_DN35_c0_g5_i1.p1 TRINITY_DN35_c0_g5~~TRINITY_DN35_c0_g5_i1.p1  ORF type:complete len:295 (+),score=147.11 TRINITY_DN35_c0_g5_i1:155-1039(+)
MNGQDESSLFFELGAPQLTCKIHPVVLFTIIDSYVRRKETYNCGALLGIVLDGVVHVRNSFSIVCDEANQIDNGYFRSALSLHLRANPSEQLVGWYSTESDVTTGTVSNHEIFSKETLNPIFLLVDISFSKSSIPLRAFTATQLSLLLQDRKSATIFNPIKVEVDKVEAEKLGAEILVKSKNSNQETVSAIISDFENLDIAISRLLDLLKLVLEYVDNVLINKVKGDSIIGRQLANCLALLPKIDLETFDKLHANDMQDLLMVVYLTNLVRLQLNISGYFQPTNNLQTETTKQT